MKCNLLAIAIPALLTINVAQALSLHNKEGKKLDLNGKVGLERDISKDDGQAGDQSFLRLGLKGEAPFEKQATIFGHLEFQKNMKSDPMAVRLAQVGLKNDEMGSLSYGRMLGVMNDVTRYTAALPVSCTDALGDGADRFGTGRATGLLQYRTPNLHGLQLALQYQGKNSLEDSKIREKVKDKQLQKANGDGYGLSVTHDTGIGVHFGAAYNRVAKESKQKANYINQGKAEMFALGARYDDNDLYLALTYAQSRNQLLFSTKDLTLKSGMVRDADNRGLYANKAQGFEVIAQYKFPSGFKPSLGYLQSTTKIETDTYQDKAKNVQFIDVGASYEFNKHLSASADYKINLLKKEKAQVLGVSVENVLGLGLTYNF